MNPDDFSKALDIAARYFRLSGISDVMISRSLRKHIFEIFQEGETRPLMLANRAIERMERELADELKMGSIQLLEPV